MVVVNKRAHSLGGFSQERLAKEDLRLLIDCVSYSRNAFEADHVTDTRLEMLIAKLQRMLKQ